MLVSSDAEEALAERSDQFVKDAPIGLQEIINADEAERLHTDLRVHVTPLGMLGAGRMGKFAG
jgi:hypothetical protein